MGKKKSSELVWLLLHLLIQFAVFSIGLVDSVGPVVAVNFALANALVHGIIDWNIWKGYKLMVYYKLKKSVLEFEPALGLPEQSNNLATEIKARGEIYKYWEDHWFYTTIGVDQFLHATTLVILYMVML